MENLQQGVDRAFDRLDQNTFAHEEKISKKVHDAVQAELPIFLAGAQQKFMENPKALLSGAFMKIVSAWLEKGHSLFVRDIGANVEELKIEMHSEVEELKKIWTGVKRGRP